MSKKLIIFTDSGDTFIDESTQVYDERGYITQADFIPGADKALRTLHDEGYRIALVGDGEVESFTNVYRKNGMRDCFDEWIISETVGVQKPNAAMFETAMKQMNLTDEDKPDIVMIGNNLRKDVAGANRFGITSIWLDWSPRYFHTFEEPDWVPDYTVKTPEELLELIGRLETEAETKVCTDLELALKYRPKISFDERDPFSVTAVGYTVFRKTKRSDSFPNRIVEVPSGGCVIEYAFWLDYDIQHLYELEHIWVYLDESGNITDAEGSTHGKYMRMVDPENGEISVDEENRVCVFAQPGKHAFASKPELFRLFPGVRESCMEKAGMEGIAPGSMVRDYFTLTDEMQDKARKYIKEHYSFEPSFHFEVREWSSDLLMPWPELLRSIPGRMQREIDKMM